MGNRTTEPLSLTFRVDTVAPVITVTTTITEVLLGDTTMVLSGTVSDGSAPLTAGGSALLTAGGGQVSDVQVSVQTPAGNLYSEPAAQDGEGWHYDFQALQSGDYVLWVNAVDQAGNVTIVGPLDLSVTCTAADLLATSVSAEPTASHPFSVTLTVVISNTGEAIPAGLAVTFYDGFTPIGTAATSGALNAGESEELSITWDVGFPGDYEVTVIANDDGSGNRSLALCSQPSEARQTVSILDVGLLEGWNLMSAYVNPFTTDASVVQRPIEGQYVVIQGFDGGAQSYYPDLPAEVNTLKEMDAEHGYWIKTVISDGLSPLSLGQRTRGLSKGDQLPALSPVEGSVISGQSADEEDGEEVAVATLRVVGEKFAEDRPIELDAGWNLVSFLPRWPVTVTDALQSINGQYAAVLGYDQGALSYYPDIDPSSNTLRNMEPLFGYWIRMNQAATLQYSTTVIALTEPVTPTAPAAARLAQIRQAERAADVTPTNTWVNFYGPAHTSTALSTGLPDGASLPVGTTVLALDPNGVVCGATVIHAEGQYGLLACYGDDPTTSEDEGAQPGDTIQLVVDGQVLGRGTWTAHGDRQWRPLGKVDLWQVYLPLIRKGEDGRWKEENGE